MSNTDANTSFMDTVEAMKNEKLSKVERESVLLDTHIAPLAKAGFDPRRAHAFDGVRTSNSDREVVLSVRDVHIEELGKIAEVFPPTENASFEYGSKLIKTESPYLLEMGNFTYENDNGGAPKTFKVKWTSGNTKIWAEVPTDELSDFLSRNVNREASTPTTHRYNYGIALVGGFKQYAGVNGYGTNINYALDEGDAYTLADELGLPEKPIDKEDIAVKQAQEQGNDNSENAGMKQKETKSKKENKQGASALNRKRTLKPPKAPTPAGR